MKQKERAPSMSGDLDDTREEKNDPSVTTQTTSPALDVGNSGNDLDCKDEIFTFGIVIVETIITLVELFVVVDSRKHSVRIFDTATKDNQSDWCLFATTGLHIEERPDRPEFFGFAVAAVILLVILLILLGVVFFVGVRTHHCKLL